MANQVSAESGQVLSLSDSADAWTIAVERELARSSAPPQFVYGWDQVAGEYENIYEQVIQGMEMPA